MKRFYAAAAIAPAEGGWRVELDGKPVKTAAGKPQQVASRALAQAMADEWEKQGKDIDLGSFRFRDLTDYALDAIAADRAGTIASLLPYGETDTLCYRSEAGEALMERQLALWEPLLCAAERRWDIHFERVSGIVHRAQPKQTMARLLAVLETQDNLTLAALRVLASLAASLVIALLALEADSDIDALWDAANLEEDWQAQLWGKDEEAEARRERRLSAFRAGATFARLARSDG